MPENDSSSLPIELSVKELRRLMDDDEPLFLLDCREPFEFEIASIAGATLIPMGQINEQLDQLEPFREKRIVVLCHHGRRSLLVAQALKNAGFPLVQSVAGGIDAWSQEIDPNVPQY